MLPVALIALLTLAAQTLVLPTAQANAPASVAWTPYDAGARIASFALAKEGTTMAAALVAPTVDPGSLPTGVGAPQSSDLSVFNHDSGKLFNSSDLPRGKSAVAVSRDGKVVAVGGPGQSGFEVGTYTVTGPIAGPTGAPGGGSTPPVWRNNVPGEVRAIAMNPTGTALAVASNPSQTEGRALLYQSQRVSVDALFPGRVNSVAITSDGQYMLAGGLVVDGSRVFGAVNLYKAPSASPAYPFSITEAGNQSEIVSVAMTPSGKYFVALTAGGKLFSFHRAGADAPSIVSSGPYTLSGGATGKRVIISEDGSFVGASGAGFVQGFARKGSGADLTSLWTAAVSGTPSFMDTDARGALLLVGTPGAAGAARFYAAHTGTPLFAPYNGDVSGVALSANGTYAAISYGSKVLSLTLPVKISFQLAPETPTDTQHARPSRPASYEAIVRNEAAAPATVSITAPRNPQVVFDVSPSSFAIAPGEEMRVRVNVTPLQLAPGLYSFNLTARAPGAQPQDVRVSFVVDSEARMSARLVGALDRVIKQGGNDTITLVIDNQGNSPVQVRVDAEQSPNPAPNWPVRIVGASEFQVGAPTTTTVQVRVETPPKIPNGSSNKVTLTVRSGAFAQAHEVVYRVNPTLGVNVTAQGRAKVLAPSDHVQFNLTVTNTGTVLAQFVASYDAQPNTGRHWVIDLNRDPFQLAPGKSHMLPVRVFAPRDGELGDRVNIQVNIASVPATIGEPLADANVTLVANVQPRAFTTTPQTPGTVVPGPGPIALAAAAATVALLLARRRREP